MSQAGLRSVLRGNVLWLSLVSLLNDTASEMVYPLLPLFLVGTLGASTAALGAIEGAANTTSSLLKLASGWLSDRFDRRKPLVAVGYGLAGVARPFLALATAAWHVLVIRVSDRTGKGIRTAPRDALLAAAVEPSYRGRAFGVHRAADHFGALVGPLLGALLLLVLADRLRLVFLIAAVPGIFAFLLVLLRVREESGAPVAVKAAPSLRGLDPSLLRFLVVAGLFTLGNATEAFLLLRASDLGVAAAAIPVLWAVHNGSQMLSAVPGGAFADRFGPRLAIGAGWALHALAYLGFAFASEAWHAWALFILYGLVHGVVEAPERALVAALAPAERRGSAFGAYHFVVGIAALPASVLFGVLWSRHGAAVPFLTAAGFGLAAAVALPLVLRRHA